MVSSLWALALLSPVLAAPAPAPRDVFTYQSHPSRTAAVQDAFTRAWNGYYKYAFPHDSLHPQTLSYGDEL
jgi:mannosyl-oligosaccharide alpha-1,2-mannosidase